MLERLVNEYNSIKSTEMDRKLALGQRIKSLKIEIGKNIQGQIEALDAKIVELDTRLGEIERELYAMLGYSESIPDYTKGKNWGVFKNALIASVSSSS